MNVIFGSYGNETIALIQWAYETQLQSVFVVSVETDWAAAQWQARVFEAEKYVQRCGFQVIRLKAPAGFAELVKERGSFPDQKFQWCAGFLKGLPLLDWLDQQDPSCQATIVMAKRSIASRANLYLQEFVEKSEHHGERRVWHPLLNLSNTERDQLITRAGFSVLNHRSLECDPCVNSQLADWQRLNNNDIEKTAKLEVEMGQPMFAPENLVGTQNIQQVIQWARLQPKAESSAEMFSMGCGEPFACGL